VDYVTETNHIERKKLAFGSESEPHGNFRDMHTNMKKLRGMYVDESLEQQI